MITADVVYKPYVNSTSGKVDTETVHRDRKICLVWYQEINCYLVFEIKVDTNYTFKACSVANDSKTDTPKSLTSSSVVFQDPVCIDFLSVSLNHLD